MLRVAVALALATTVARADDDGEPARAPDETIVITGLRLPREVRDEPTAVTVIDREEIARSPMVLADDLLRTSPSVGTFRRSSSAIADPTSQGLSLRGVGPSAVSRALVLRDGIPANDPFGGWMYWRSISALALDRIEIAPSGASALFGNFALGGAVDLVSRPITDGAIEAVLAGGTLGTGWSAARVTEKAGAFGVAIDGEAFHTEGYTPISRAQRGPIDGDASSTHGSGAARIEYTRGRSLLYATGRYFRQALDWPDVSYGIEYKGDKIRDGITQKAGTEQPIYYWDPVIAPSGMTFYTGASFPAWRGNLFVGALAGKHVARLTLDGTRIVGEERLLADRARIRDVRTGPDGNLYVLTDAANGELLRLAPAGDKATQVGTANP